MTHVQNILQENPLESIEMWMSAQEFPSISGLYTELEDWNDCCTWKFNGPCLYRIGSGRRSCIWHQARTMKSFRFYALQPLLLIGGAMFQKRSAPSKNTLITHSLLTASSNKTVNISCPPLLWMWVRSNIIDVELLRSLYFRYVFCNVETSVLCNGVQCSLNIVQYGGDFQFRWYLSSDPEWRLRYCCIGLSEKAKGDIKGANIYLNI